MRRSAVSILSNIAEGYMRGTREYVQFQRVALGSAAELDPQVSLARDLGYIAEGIFVGLQGELEEIIKLLRSYIAKVTGNHVRENEPPVP